MLENVQLGDFKGINNPYLNYGEFAIIKNQASLNGYKISVKSKFNR